MKKELSDITLIVDRSGSMSSCKDEAQGGINAFIKDQKEKPGEATFSLMQFDTQHEYVFNAVPIKSVEKYELQPRGMTALLDAVGKTIAETEQRINALKKSQKPGLVVIAIITDGQENSSHEFKRSAIRDLIEKKQKDGWQFTFLGANQDAFTEAATIGISADATSNYNVKNSAGAYAGLSANVSRMRTSSFVGQAVNCSYSDDERKNMT